MKTEIMFPINLQLFAEGEAEVETEVEVEADTEVETEVETETEGEAEVEEVEVEQPRNDSVPLAKYMAEKKKRQDMERLFATQEAERERLKIVQDYVDQGYPQYTAEYHANTQIQQKLTMEQTQSKLNDMEIKDLARSDSFYSDAESFKDEIKDKMKALNIGAEEAYMLVRGKARTREVQIEREQSSAAKRKQVESKKVANSSSSAPSNPYKLDEADRKALAGLQKMNPDGGWTAEKYYKLLKQT